MASLKLKDDYADTFCRSISSTYYEVQYTLDTDLFAMIIEKVPLRTRAFNRTYFNPKNMSTFVQIPMNDVAANEFAINPNIVATCI